VGAASAALLTGTLLGQGSGALQRAGLGVVDAWFVAMAVRVLAQSVKVKPRNRVSRSSGTPGSSTRS